MADYWISTSGGTLIEIGRGVAVDSSGNVYVGGYGTSTGAGGYDSIITKYNAFGTIQWQRTLGGINPEGAYSIAVDASGNVYISMDVFQTLGVAKYDTNGVIQWQRTLGPGTTLGWCITVDSSGNVYVGGYTNSQGAGGTDLLVAKYNTSGTIQWQRVLGGAGSELGFGIAVDSSGNVYVTGYTNSQGAGSTDLLVVKYDTSGTIQWQRILGANGNDQGVGIAVDSSGNFYIGGHTDSQGAGVQDLLVAKYNTSGTIQWQRRLGGTVAEYGQGIAVDSSGNVYVTGYTNSQGAGSVDLLVAKYDTSGTIQWQRVLGGTGGDIGRGIAVDSSGNVYVTGETDSTGAGSTDLLVAKLPGDGSLTGVYGPFTYAVSTLTAATSTLTDAASTLTAATSTLTDAAATLTDMDIITTTIVG